MSVKVLAKFWLATAKDLKDVIIREKAVQTLQPVSEPAKAHQILASLYARYVILVNNLGDIFDQTLQVQKRQLLQKVLESATQRMLELQNELKKIEMSEFIYLDGTLIEEKLTPQDVQLIRPFYYPAKRSEHIQNIIDGIRPDKMIDEPPTEEERRLKLMGTEKPKLTPEQKEEATRKQIIVDAINLIKKHEKARQARVLLTNIRLHPEIYMPKPHKKIMVPYDFFHKSDQTMLIPVKRTHYNKEFRQEIRTLSKLQFWTKPTADGEMSSLPEVNISANLLQDIIEQTGQLDEKSTETIDAIMAENLQRRKLRNEAATKIQRCWHRYCIHKLVKARKLKQKIILCMVDDCKINYDELKRIQVQREAKRSRKPQFDQQFIKACEDEKARILKFKGEWIMEDISDHIRSWFYKMYAVGEEFDDYPPEAKGGTILVVRGLTRTTEEFFDYVKQKRANEMKSPEEIKKLEAEAKEAERQAKETAKLARQKEKQLLQKIKAERERKGPAWYFNEPEFVTKSFLKLEDGLKEYELEWRFIDEAVNRKEEPIMDWIQIDKYAEAHQELRLIVDQFMRIEYELLKKALCLDRKKPYKPPKPPKLPKTKKEKRKKAKPKEEKPIEPIYDELAQAGVICAYPKVRLDDYVGDIHLDAFEMRNFMQLNPMHAMGDTKFVLQSWILGMGPLNMKKAKSICIAGPPGSGKKLLAYALCDEMGAVMFNLSPHIVVKFADKMNDFVAALTKMIKVLAPSVMFIDGAHYPFISKMTPEESVLNPRLLGTFLPKIMKSFKPEEKIMLIGTSNSPWNGAMAKMKKIYEKNILIPTSEYGSTLLTWRAGLMKKCGIDKTMELSALTKVTTEYGTKQILDTCDRIVDMKRRVRLSRKPLTEEELLDGLLNGPSPNFPIPEKEKNKYLKWFNKANKLAGIRAAYTAELERIKAELESKGKK